MDLNRLIAELSDPAAHPGLVGSVEVRQTHISVVFLTEDWAYKVKKPVKLGFLDYGTLERRRHFCQEEVRLNRRLAPEIYLGVVPITEQAGQLRFEGNGPAVEWAVKMRRLPDAARIKEWLLRGELERGTIEALAHKLAAFHRAADGGPEIARSGHFHVVARNARDNFDQSAGQVGDTISDGVHERLRRLTDATLQRWRGLIEGRADRLVPRDTHGDLRLDHVFYFPDRTPPGDLLIIDCIEFSEQYRHADPVADLAFLHMDLIYHGRRDLARVLAERYAIAAQDEEGALLLPFYTSYRAAVRGKVEGLKLAETEVPAAERERARQKARAHWLLALEALEEPTRRPGVVLVGGMPGTGKSTLARSLASRAGFEVVRSDLVRKQLAATSDPPPAHLYSPEWDDRTYDACLARVERGLWEGRRVLVDATFRDATRRRQFLDAARNWAVPTVALQCQASPELVRERLEGRRDDPSDADWQVYQRLAACWNQDTPHGGDASAIITTDLGPDDSLDAALAALRQAGLW